MVVALEFGFGDTSFIFWFTLWRSWDRHTEADVQAFRAEDHGRVMTVSFDSLPDYRHSFNPVIHMRQASTLTLGRYPDHIDIIQVDVVPVRLDIPHLTNIAVKVDTQHGIRSHSLERQRNLSPNAG